MKEKQKKPFYKRKWFIALVVLIVIGALGSGGDEETNRPATDNTVSIEQSDGTELASVENTESATKEEIPAKTEEIEEEPIEEVKEPTETLSQKNAVRMAKSYLNYTAFSKDGLVEQLKFEGFDDEDANYAVNQINVNWKEQAVKMAEHYLNYTSFSRSGLIEQLKFEGFSNEEATHAVNEIGL